MSDHRKELALRAVLMFHSSEPWTEARQREWEELFGYDRDNPGPFSVIEPTTKALCDLVREALAP